MKTFVILSLVAGCAFAGSLKPGRNYRSEDNKGNYAFGYAGERGSFHEESGSPGMKLGTYGVTDADGTQRVVNYIADENGFRAQVEIKEKDPLEAAASQTVISTQAKVETPEAREVTDDAHHDVVDVQDKPVLVEEKPVVVDVQDQPALVEAKLATIDVQDKPAVAGVQEKPQVYVAQAQPLVVEVVTTTATPVVEKSVRRVDEAVPEQTVAADVSKTPNEVVQKEPVQPAVPVPVEQVGGFFVQPSQVAQQLPNHVFSPRPQDIPGTVFFVPIPHQVAYSRTHSYSVHGYVPVPVVSPHQAPKEGPSYHTRIQHGVRAQIPQIPSPYYSIQYVGQPSSQQAVQPYSPYMYTPISY